MAVMVIIGGLLGGLGAVILAGFGLKLYRSFKKGGAAELSG